LKYLDVVITWNNIQLNEISQISRLRDNYSSDYDNVNLLGS